MLKASEHDTDSERSFLLMATPLSGLPMAVSSLYAGMCLALTRESISSSERRKHLSWKKKSKPLSKPCYIVPYTLFSLPQFHIS